MITKKVEFCQKRCQLMMPKRKKQVNRYATGESHHGIGIRGWKTLPLPRHPILIDLAASSLQLSLEAWWVQPIEKVYLLCQYMHFYVFLLSDIWSSLSMDHVIVRVREGANEMCGHMCVRLCFCFWIYISYVLVRSCVTAFVCLCFCLFVGCLLACLLSFCQVCKMYHNISIYIDCIYTVSIDYTHVLHICFNIHARYSTQMPLH